MLFGGIALVGGPVVLRIFLGYAAHIFVAVGLGEHRSCRYAHHLAVALHYGGVRDVGVWGEAIAVDEQCFGTYLEGIDGAVHGGYRGFEDIYLVDFFRRHESHSPSQCFALYNGAK